jgi:hypothetical protein
MERHFLPTCYRLSRHVTLPLLTSSLSLPTPHLLYSARLTLFYNPTLLLYLALA